MDLDVGVGEVFGLFGPAGSGKSTLLRILSGLERPDEGTGRVAGVDLLALPHQVRSQVGFVPLRPCLDPRLTVQGNLAFYCSLSRVPRAHRTGRVLELLHVLDLFDCRDAPVGALSEGEQRRVDLARALLHLPQVLLWDEPLLGFDARLRKRFWEYFHDRRSTGAFTVVLASSTGAGLDRCQRIAVLNAGSLVTVRTPASLRGAAAPDVVTLRPVDDSIARKRLRDRLQVAVEMEDGSFRLEVRRGDQFVSELMKDCGAHVEAVAVRRPSLDDALLEFTGKGARLPQEDEGASEEPVSYDLAPYPGPPPT